MYCRPLRAEEKLPVRSHREAPPPSKSALVDVAKKCKKKGSKKDEEKKKKKSKKDTPLVMDLIQNGEHSANQPPVDVIFNWFN